MSGNGRRDIILSTKVCIVKTMVFPVVIGGSESWAMKKAEGLRIDDFELWCWRRLLRVPWTARRSNQSILKKMIPEYSLEGMMLNSNILATWCEELIHWKRPWCWETLKAKEEGGRRWDGWIASPIQWTWTPGKLQEMVRDKEAWRAPVHGIAKRRTWLSEWTAGSP